LANTHELSLTHEHLEFEVSSQLVLWSLKQAKSEWSRSSQSTMYGERNGLRPCGHAEFFPNIFNVSVHRPN